MDQESQQNDQHDPNPDPVARNLDEERKKFEAIIKRQPKADHENITVVNFYLHKPRNFDVGRGTP